MSLYRRLKRGEIPRGGDHRLIGVFSVKLNRWVRRYVRVTGGEKIIGEDQVYRRKELVKVWRIRRQSGYAGGFTYYHHADVMASTWWQALQAAKEGRVKNWRWIDRFDEDCSKDYTEYEYLYRVSEDRVGLSRTY